MLFDEPPTNRILAYRNRACTVNLGIASKYTRSPIATVWRLDVLLRRWVGVSTSVCGGVRRGGVQYGSSFTDERRTMSTDGPFPIAEDSYSFDALSFCFRFFFFFLSFFRIVDLLYRTIASNLFEIITLKTMYRGKKKLEKKIIRFKCILNRILSEWNLPDFGFFVKIRIEDERSENGMINRRFVTWCSLVFRWNLFDRITKGIENANYFPRRSQ